MAFTSPIKSIHIQKIFEGHWKTDTHLAFHYPNHLHINSQHLPSYTRLRGLKGLYLLKQVHLIESRRRHGKIHGSNIDMPTEKISEDAAQSGVVQKDFLVVSFYHFVRIEEPHEEVTRHRLFLEGREIKGRIYINEQGINAQYSGPFLDALAYAEWVKEDDRFKHVLVQTSPSSTHAFPRLKLRYKSSLVQVEGGTSHLPLLDPSMRALPLTSTEWKGRLSITNCSKTDCDTISSMQNTSFHWGRSLLLLDNMNGTLAIFWGQRDPMLTASGVQLLEVQM